MRIKRSKNSGLLIVVMCFSGSMQAQTSVNASGGDASGSGGTVAYSVGQVVYTSNSASTGTVDQGVQHAYEIYTVSIKEIAMNISLTAFPNPTTENLTLRISDYNNEKLSYQLFDLQGKALNTGQIVGPQTLINMNSLPRATYFLNVLDQENKKVQSFKIIKTQ